MPPGTLQNLFDDVDIVFHLAAQLGEWGVDHQQFYDVNVGGTRQLLELCREKERIRFVYASTPGVQGKGHQRADETMPYNPPYIYEQTKCLAEQFVLAFHQRYDLAATIVRPDFVYGPGDYRRIPLYRAIKQRRFFIIGNGRSFLHPTYISDAVDGLVRAATHPDAVGQVFNIAGPNLISVSDYVLTIARTMGVRPPLFKIPKWLGMIAAHGCERIAEITQRPPFVSQSKIEFLTFNHGCNIQKANAVLGFKPQVPFEDGFRHTWAWVANHGSG